MTHGTGDLLMSHSTFAVSASCFVLLSLGAAACSASPSTTDAPGVGEDAIVYDTIVSAHADGSWDVRNVAITLRDRHAQEAERAAFIAGTTETTTAHDGIGTTSEALNADPTCNGTDFWGYDGPNVQNINYPCPG
jgi:hypothetical protein